MTNDDPTSEELPVSKLLEFLKNIELISGKKILDLDSLTIVETFMNNNANQGLVITLPRFRQFFHDLIGTPLQEVIGTPPKLNYTQNPTSAFINKELENLKKQTRMNGEEIRYGDRIINDLNSKNTETSSRNALGRENLRKLHSDLDDSKGYNPKLYDTHDKRPIQELILELDTKLDEQHRLIDQLLKNSQGKTSSQFTIKSINQTPAPKSSKVAKRSINWTKIGIYLFVALMSLSILNMGIEVFQDFLSDYLLEEIEL